MIKVRNLWKSYRKNPVLEGLDLDIEEGETVVILGRSGVGKSVLLKQIMGLEKPDQGSIEINGVEITGLKGPALYHAISQMGMLFQGAALFDSMTIGDNTGFYLKQHGDPQTKKKISHEEIQERVIDALKMVGLEGTENELPSNLSGGMRKRAALARLIVYKPRILLYDEPTTGLDPITASQINDLIIATQRQLKATSIVVTHDLRSAFSVGNRLALHDHGKIEVIADKMSFVKNDNPLIQTFLKHALLTDAFVAEKIDD